MSQNRTGNKKQQIPPVSPYGLIQEALWPNGWKILVACILLNCTSRRQIDKVIDKLFKKYPNAISMSFANKSELSEIISSLGFCNRRSETLIKMSKKYIQHDWKKASDLPGIGEYANAAWEIFIEGKLPDKSPKDGALKTYHEWRMKNGF